MTITYAILGMLSYRPLTGYDLKKGMQESSFMYWSGNSNQIYKALLELSANGYVKGETCHREGSPSKKIYTITESGLAELKRGALSEPEPPQTKKPFLVQWAWTRQLSNIELNRLLDQYEQVIKGQLIIEQNKKSCCVFETVKTDRDIAVLNLIHENVIDGLEQELSWIRKMRHTLEQFDTEDCTVRDDVIPNSIERGKKTMNYQIVERSSDKYVYLNTSGKQLQTEEDALDLLSICAENRINLLLIQGERLSDDFYNLRTGAAGAILQKLANYNIKAAVVIDADSTKGRFKEFLTEINRGKMFNTYSNIEDAESWLLKKN